MFLVNFSLKKPKVIIALTIFFTLIFLLQFPKIKVDTDPKNMLPITSKVRTYDKQVENWFDLHPDIIVLGISDNKEILNPTTLKKIQKLTKEIQSINGVIEEDVISLTTVDNITSDKQGTLNVASLIEENSFTSLKINQIKKSLLDNPLFLNRIISTDLKTTAIFIPISPKTNGMKIAKKIKKIAKKNFKKNNTLKFYLAGDPVARDTFGKVMFVQMGIFSPIAGMIMFIALLVMFRSFALAGVNMLVAMISIIWSMGLLIALGYPVHIMSSMIPVFLMSIATDSIHIYNELYFRLKEINNKSLAILKTMQTVALPIFYVDLVTIIGFAALAVATIIPVKVFGIFVAFGTLIILLTSFTLIPAILFLMSEEKLKNLSQFESEETTSSTSSKHLAKLSSLGVYQTKIVILIGITIFAVSILGITKIKINNNLVKWFKKNNEIRKADSILNKNLGGTSLAYLVVDTNKKEEIKNPQVLKYIENLQNNLQSQKNLKVGKIISVVDILKQINKSLHNDNVKFFTLPDKREVIAQYLFLFSMSAKPRDVNNFIDISNQKANIFLQLKSWDASALKDVLNFIQDYQKKYPLKKLTLKPAGTPYFNMVWDDEVRKGMLDGFALGIILVLIILVFNFKSLFWAMLGLLPLIFTIVLIYGFVGLLGKDFDMPISVLSTLSLGLAVDFSIHFINRFRIKYKENKNLDTSLIWTSIRPGKGIIRNAFLFALGFSAMIFANLTPYITVGAFMIFIMLISSLSTLILLPALIKTGEKYFLRKEEI